MDATLPLVFCGGFPRSLYDLSEAELERFLIYIWNFTNTAKQAQVLPALENRELDRVQSLRSLICAVYERLGVSYLLYFSEGLAKTKGPNIYYEIDPKRNFVVVWNKKNKTVIARIPASNVCYDAFSGKLEIPKAKIRRRQRAGKKRMGEECSPVTRKIWSSHPVVQIELLDSDTEDPLHNGQNKVAEESIIISDSEEPLNDKNQDLRKIRKDSPKKNFERRFNNKLCSWVPNIYDSVSITKTLQLKTDKGVPFISNAISVTKVVPNAQTRNGRPDVNKGSDPVLVSLIDDDDSIVISDSEDTRYDRIVISDSEDTGDQDPPLRNACHSRFEEEIVISDSEDAIDLENKCNFLYRLGLCEPTNVPDDPIILPIPGKGDFNKFHRLPLMMVPLLVKHSLIDKHSAVPGPPGQNSHFTSTNKRDVSENINKSKRTLQKFGRYKTLDLDSCVDYKYPKKHFRSILPAPLPLKKRQRKLPPAKEYSYSNKKSYLKDCTYLIPDPVVKIEKLDVHIYLKYLKKL